MYDKQGFLPRVCDPLALTDLLNLHTIYCTCTYIYIYVEMLGLVLMLYASRLLTAFYMAAGEIRHYIHPWWRHLPMEIQEVLSQVKASMQRTIGLVQVTGKLANEEIGKRGGEAQGGPSVGRGLRVAGAEHLVYRSRAPSNQLQKRLFKARRRTWCPTCSCR